MHRFVFMLEQLTQCESLSFFDLIDFYVFLRVVPSHQTDCLASLLLISLFVHLFMRKAIERICFTGTGFCFVLSPKKK